MDFDESKNYSEETNGDFEDRSDDGDSDGRAAAPDETDSASVSSYEWNSDSESGASERQGGTGEYRYSYINGSNRDSAHNPNNYENAYSSPYRTDGGQYSQGGQSGGNYGGQQFPTYGGYSSDPYGAQRQPSGYGTNFNQNPQKVKKVKKVKQKKPKKPASRGFAAAMLIIAIILSATLGFGGGYLANVLTSSGCIDGGLTINKVESGDSAALTASSGTVSDIVRKTADSVVEIVTESVVTGSFARQYIQEGAGSGIIISEDGYIITNYHVIEDANTIEVTLRDTSTYSAVIVGSDEDSDIALLKIDAQGLSPCTFGDSSELEVGDYVIAIGNPLGELGGTVTDGIISALAREVTIEDNQMTLLQTNAQISPGNSGGGLFNADGELVGIVNAKDSATEVEGIAFAIPINNVLDILSDLKEYGYVTGRIDLGMEFTDITSDTTAFYYGVNRTGCYVLSVDSGSNAEKAGMTRGDLITAVNGTEISTSSEIETLLENSEVGDTVEFTVYRRGSTSRISFELEEYIPTVSAGSQSSASSNEDSDSIWRQMFGW